MNAEGLGGLEAAASVVGATGAATVARGCVTARTGAGVYTITLDRALDASECLVACSVRGAANVALKVVHTDDLIKTVSSVALAAGQAATDSDFDFAIFRIAAGGL